MSKSILLFFLLGMLNVLLLGGCAKDERVVLSSESADDFLIKHARSSSGFDKDVEGVAKISKSKLARAIERRVHSVSRVYDISDWLDEDVFLFFDYWTISFSIRTISGKVYKEVKCRAIAIDGDYGSCSLLKLSSCGTDDGGGARFEQRSLEICLREILSNPGDLSTLR